MSRERILREIREEYGCRRHGFDEWFETMAYWLFLEHDKADRSVLLQAFIESHLTEAQVKEWARELDVEIETDDEAYERVSEFSWEEAK